MSRVLVVDDEQIIRDLMLEILVEAGYNAVGAPTAESALERLSDPDLTLVVSDVIMPGLSGIELLEKVRAQRPSLPVVLVSGAGTYSTLSEALARGADGLVMKPFSHGEFRAAVASALDRSHRSEAELGERLLLPALATALANAIEARDAATRGHCERLAAVAAWLGVEAGLAPYEVEIVRLGAILHDVGKIGIPDEILLKKGSLDPTELEVMQSHPLVGDRLLEPLPMLQSVRPVVRYHHERWDGTGYPDGLAGADIPRVARVVAVADAIEAMWADRPYRGQMTLAAIIGELEGGAGTQWDPELTGLALQGIRRGDLAFHPAGIKVCPHDADASSMVTVLLVEDDPMFADLASEVIREAFGEARVVVARDAASAKELCRGSVWSLAVVDHGLPDGDGLDLLRVIRETSPNLPILMLTGHGTEQLAVEAFRRGANDYVVKGTTFSEELAGRVRHLLEAA